MKPNEIVVDRVDFFLLAARLIIPSIRNIFLQYKETFLSVFLNLISTQDIDNKHFCYKKMSIVYENIFL